VSDAVVGRRCLDKQFHGDLEGTSKGLMLSSAHSDQGLGGLCGHGTGSWEVKRVGRVGSGVRTGSFVLQHSSRMTSGAPTQSITVVPDSGTEGLIGIAGSMTIDIVEEQHFYSLDYRFEGDEGA